MNLRLGLGLFLVALAAQAQPISFLPPVRVIGGLRFPFPANSLVEAVFNGDGKSALLVLNVPQGLGQNPLTVSRGNGDGTFQPPQTLISTVPLASPVVADFNGDGKPDIAVIGSNLNLIIFVGNGDATFHPALITALPSPASSLVSADFDHDGIPDLIVGQTIFMGKGDGTFQARPTTLDAPVAGTADFNHDGKPDILLVQSKKQIAVALGNGDGTFGKELPVPAPFTPGSFITGDFNADGMIDIAISATAPLACVINCATPIGSIALLKGNGDGTFQAPILTPNAMGPILAAADMNHDGHLDLIVGNSVLAGLGDGTFRFPAFYGLDTFTCLSASSCQVTANFAAAIADFNGDGLNDIAEAFDRPDPVGSFSEPGVSILLNDSPGDGLYVTGVSSASYIWPTGATSLVTAFGVNLDQTRVHMFDRVSGMDTLAPILYSSPSQLNFEVSTTDTFVYISLERVGSPYVPKGMIIPVQPLAPDLFNSFTEVVIDGATYLSLYGTGFEAAPSPSCTVSGVGVVQTTYSGPQLQIPGLDQINLLLPSGLGKGLTAVQCSFGTVATNIVHFLQL